MWNRERICGCALSSPESPGTLSRTTVSRLARSVGQSQPGRLDLLRHVALRWQQNGQRDKSHDILRLAWGQASGEPRRAGKGTVSSFPGGRGLLSSNHITPHSTVRVIYGKARQLTAEQRQRRHSYPGLHCCRHLQEVALSTGV